MVKVPGCRQAVVAISKASVERCLVAITGQRCQSEGKQRNGCRSGWPWSGQGLGLLVVVLDHGQLVRVFVLSIGQAGHEATTAPA